jgi:hypothetical protein
MKIIVLIFFILICNSTSAQRKHWENNIGEKVKKKRATGYYTLSKTPAKTYLLKRYHKTTDRLYEEINYTTKEKINKNGSYTLYFENSQMALQGNYLNNLKSGVWKYYHENGTLDESFTYKLGVKEGEQSDYKNNKLIARYRYKNEKLDGLTLLLDQEGNQVFKEDTSEIAVYTFVDQEAIFPGGKKKLELYLKVNFINSIEFMKEVYVSFNIDSKGRVTEIEVNKETDNNIPEDEIKQALKTIARMPLWEPAMKRGRVVKSSQQIKIEF